MLDLDTFKWKQTEWEGEQPAARMGLLLFCFFVFIFCFLFNHEQQITFSFVIGHSALGISDSRMLVFGGGTNAFFQDNSMFTIDLK